MGNSQNDTAPGIHQSLVSWFQRTLLIWLVLSSWLAYRWTSWFDGAPDPFDNCINVANGPLAGALNQTDDDNDGIGTACDCDYTQDNIVLGDDLLQLFAVFNQSSPPAAPDFDHDGDGFVLGTDTLICFAQFNGPPGPPTL